jgi:predicted transcriptional regulator
MRLSTKGRYGLRAMIDIAQKQETGPVAINAIADRQNLSGRYLEQLLTPLKQAGLVKSVRGSQGGYILGRNAALYPESEYGASTAGQVFLSQIVILVAGQTWVINPGHQRMTAQPFRDFTSVADVALHS